MSSGPNLLYRSGERRVGLVGAGQRARGAPGVEALPVIGEEFVDTAVGYRKLGPSHLTLSKYVNTIPIYAFNVTLDEFIQGCVRLEVLEGQAFHQSGR